MSLEVLLMLDPVSIHANEAFSCLFIKRKNGQLPVLEGHNTMEIHMEWEDDLVYLDLCYYKWKCLSNGCPCTVSSPPPHITIPWQQE